MKVLHISTSDSGGAGLAALRLHRALSDQGIESKMLVAQKTSDDENVFVAQECELNKYIPPKNRFLRKFQKIMRRRGKYLTRLEKIKQGVRALQSECPAFYTYDISSYDLASNPLVKEADVVHLHWIQDFLDFETFFARVDKPIVWTFHDLNPMYGGFHHYRLREKYYQRYKVVEDYLYEIKKNSLINQLRLSVVALSSEMNQLISSHEIYKNKKIFQIPNCVDGTQFEMMDKSMVRRLMKIEGYTKVFLFINSGLNDSEKGLDELSEALSSLTIENALFICVGQGQVPVLSNMKVLHIQPVRDHIWLSMLYSAADLLLFPSYQECFAQTPMEAMCCGTPVVMTPVSGYGDLIGETNGIVCNGFGRMALKEGIVHALGSTFESEKVRDSVIEKYSPNKIAREYIGVYKASLNL